MRFVPEETCIPVNEIKAGSDDWPDHPRSRTAYEPGREGNSHVKSAGVLVVPIGFKKADLVPLYVIYQTRKIVFDHISKHREES